MKRSGASEADQAYSHCLHIGWEIMGNRDRESDIKLVEQCLKGSEQAWSRFYQKHIGLVRNVVRRKVGAASHDLEDMTQETFAALVSSLDSYNPDFSLARFVGTIAERICIQNYRRSAAAKRDAETRPVDHHDGGDEGAERLVSRSSSPEERVVQSQLVIVLRAGLKRLDERCRDLLKLRYYEELPYEEISKMVGAPKRTLAVRVMRCIDQLRAGYRRLVRKGVNS